MNVAKKKKMISRMNSTAQQTKFSEDLVFTTKKELASADVDAGKTTIDVGFAYKTICSVLVTASNGSVRAVTKIEAVDNEPTKVKLTVTSLAAGDTVCVQAQ